MNTKPRLSSFRCSRHHEIILIIILMFTMLQISFWGSNPPRSPLPSMKGKHNNEQMASRLWHHYNQMASKFLSLLFISPQSMLINEQGSGTKFSLFPSFAIISMQSSILLSWLVFVTVIRFHCQYLKLNLWQNVHRSWSHFLAILLCHRLMEISSTSFYLSFPPLGLCVGRLQLQN